MPKSLTLTLMLKLMATQRQWSYGSRTTGLEQPVLEKIENLDNFIAPRFCFDLVWGNMGCFTVKTYSYDKLFD
jgi:hypothetical protein